VDLMLTVDDATKPVLMNALTAPSAGTLVTVIHADLSKVRARSLAGEHRVIVTRSPLA